jgi:hypothetical protein
MINSKILIYFITFIINTESFCQCIINDTVYSIQVPFQYKGIYIKCHKYKTEDTLKIKVFYFDLKINKEVELKDVKIIGYNVDGSSSFVLDGDWHSNSDIITKHNKYFISCGIKDRYIVFKDIEFIHNGNKYKIPIQQYVCK